MLYKDDCFKQESEGSGERTIWKQVPKSTGKHQERNIL